MRQKKVWAPKECKQCKKMFEPWNNTQTMCHNPCRSRARLTIAESNALWVKRTEEEKKKQYKNSKSIFDYGNISPT